MTETVAFLGTGIMGAAMARNLLAAGMEVRIWNRSREKMQAVAEEGAEVANSPAEAADGADFLITMLSDSRVIEEVVSAQEALSALSSDGVWVQMSTVGVEDTERLAQMATKRNVAFVDAPVVGTKQPAERGTLTVLASGPDEARQRCEPVFDAVGNETLWLGPAGAGTRLKLVVNNWIAGLLGVLAETIALAKALQVDPALFLKTIDGRPLNTPYAQMKGEMMIREDFPASFSVKLARKDVDLILDAASACGLKMALTEAVGSRFHKALEAGYGDEDMAAIYRAINIEGGR